MSCALLQHFCASIHFSTCCFVCCADKDLASDYAASHHSCIGSGRVLSSSNGRLLSVAPGAFNVLTRLLKTLCRASKVSSKLALICKPTYRIMQSCQNV
eukprot:6190624-Pleurochrysis_carterae.AAC.3